MVYSPFFGNISDMPLSVLALSSRFDGPRRPFFAYPACPLSVLALSSRFDGHDP